MKLSRWFTAEEMAFSATARRRGLDNTPGYVQHEALRALCVNVLDLLRDYVGDPIYVDSGYRSPAVNASVGGEIHSQHLLGQAVDIRSAEASPAALLETVRRLKLPVDQCIDEFGEWLHISHVPGGPQRGQFLRARWVDGKRVYEQA